SSKVSQKITSALSPISQFFATEPVRLTVALSLDGIPQRSLLICRDGLKSRDIVAKATLVSVERIARFDGQLQVLLEVVELALLNLPRCDWVCR
ncbi:hypothetical protein, partial [Rhizobium sp. FKY42]|uniref:hypothetical protein n=1 Tax=Rhizobium sp. FKY42 TaxID=2562310 RepID=UPI00197EABC1